MSNLDANLESRNRRMMLLVLLVMIFGVVALVVYMLSDGEESAPAGVQMQSVPTPEGKLKVGSRLSDYRWGGHGEAQPDTALPGRAYRSPEAVWHVEYEDDPQGATGVDAAGNLLGQIAAENARMAAEDAARRAAEDAEQQRRDRRFDSMMRAQQAGMDPLALMEKSYELNAKYAQANQGLGQGNSGVPSHVAPAKPKRSPRSTGVAPTALPKETVQVSAGKEESVRLKDSGWVLPRPRNGFYGLSDAKPEVVPNSFRAVVDQTVTLRQNEYVKLRLLDAIPMQRVTLPAGTVIVAQGQVEGNRMRLFVERLELGGYIFSVRLSAFDLDGQEGIFIPNSSELQAAQEAGAQASSAAGTNLTLNSSAKDQAVSELSKIAISSAAKYVEARIRELRIHLKSGYRLFLVVQEDNQTEEK